MLAESLLLFFKLALPSFSALGGECLEQALLNLAEHRRALPG